jgi:hypothetical protein
MTGKEEYIPVERERFGLLLYLGLQSTEWGLPILTADIPLSNHQVTLQPRLEPLVDTPRSNT